MTRLSDHLCAAELTQSQFAKRVGVDQATISKLCRGVLMPSLPLAVRIERATSGAVSASSWISDAESQAGVEAAE